MDQNDLSLDLLLQETLALTEYLRASTPPKKESIETTIDDTDYLLDLADSMISDEVGTEAVQLELPLDQAVAPTEYVATQIPDPDTQEAIIASPDLHTILYPPQEDIRILYLLGSLYRTLYGTP